MMRLERVAFDDPELIDFLKDHSTCIFDQAEWSRVLKEGFESEVVFYCLREDGRIVMALPGIIFNFRIIRMFYSNIPYGGFLGKMENFSLFLDLLEKTLKKDHIHFIRISKNFQTSFPDLKGYSKHTAYTHLLDLGQMTEERVWTNYKKRVRRDIRKAEKSGITIHEAKGSQEIDLLFDLYVDTMRRNKAYNTWSRKALHSIDQHLVNKREAKILLAKRKDEAIAGTILIFSPDTVYYFFAASAHQHLSLCPNDLLVHHGICLAIREGRRLFDLMASQKEDVALMSFKEKWGAQKYPFYFYEKSLNFPRTWLWRKVWWMINTSAGAHMLRWWRGR